MKAKKTKAKQSSRKKFIGAYILLCLLFQEAAFRFFFPFPEVKNFNRVSYMPLSENRKETKPVRNINLVWKSAPDSVSMPHHLNNYGFRDHNWNLQKKEGVNRIIFIGDSYVEGNMAPEEEVMTKGFIRSAEKGKENAEIMNMGVSGGDVKSYLRLITDAVPIFKPDEVFVVIYVNDLPCDPILPVTGLQPEYYNKLVPRIFEILKLLKQNEPLPFRWNYRSVDYFPSAPDPDNPWTKNEEDMRKHVKPVIAEEMKKGNFNPYVINALLYRENNLRIPVSLTAQLSYLKELSIKNNFKLHLVYLPSRNQVSSYYNRFEKEFCTSCADSFNLVQPLYQQNAGQIRRSCDSLEIAYYDLTPDLKGKEDEGERLFWNYDEHMKGAGYRFCGETLYKWSRKK